MSNRTSLQSAKPKTTTIALRDGQEVRIRELSGAGRAEYLKRHQETRDSGGISAAQVVAMALVEEDGSNSFDANSPEDLAYLDSLSGEVLDQIAGEFFKLSGLAAKSVDEARGN